MHKNITEMLKEKCRGVDFEFRIKPGQTGVDIQVPDPAHRKITGFEYAEIKPRNCRQEAKLARQVENWGLKPCEVRPFTYDEKGKVYDGF